MDALSGGLYNLLPYYRIPQVHLNGCLLVCMYRVAGWLVGPCGRWWVGACLGACSTYSTQFSVLLVLFLSSSVPPHFLWRGATFFRLRECLIYSDLALHFKRGINNESTHTRYSTVDVKK